MARSYDAVVVGGGVNGLVAAATLARRGRSVLLLERRSEVGGAAATVEIAPGFRGPLAFAGVETFHPAVARQLRLAAHGLRLSPAGAVAVVGSGAPLLLPPPEGEGATPAAAAVAGRSPDDAAALVACDTFLRRLGAAFARLLARPLPALPPSGVRGLADLFLPLWRLRWLGRRDFSEALRYLPMPVADVVEERFADAALKVAVAASGVAGSWLGPRSPGSALNLLLHRCGGCRGAVPHPRFAVGGPGALAAALAAAAGAAGAEIRVGVEVRAVRVAAGRAVGVVTAAEEEIGASQVLSALDPRRTLLELVGREHLDPDVLTAVGAVRSRGSVGVVLFALDRAPQLGVDGAWRILVADGVDGIERAFDDAKHGREPRRPFLDLTVPSLADPTLAPPGKHLLAAWVQYPPSTLDGGWGEEARGRLGERVEALIAEHDPGFAASVVARRVWTPADLEERLGVTGGCLYHVEPALDQELYLRPLPGWGRHTTPIDGLFLAGAGTHGGGPLTGLAGRNAAAVAAALSR